jgi:hypothetical protein
MPKCCRPISHAESYFLQKRYQTVKLIKLLSYTFDVNLYFIYFILLQFLLLNAEKAFAVASRGSAPNPVGGASPIVGCLTPSAFDVSQCLYTAPHRGMLQKLLTLHAKHCFTLSL